MKNICYARLILGCGISQSYLIISSTCVFPGMKVYVTDEKELIMEPYLKWAANPNITVAVRAFGLKATVQVLCLSQ